MYLVLHGSQNLLAHQDLPWLGFIAQPRSQIWNRANGGVVASPFEPDDSQGRIALRGAEAETELVAEPPPFLCQGLHTFPHLNGHANRATGVVLAGEGGVEEHQQPAAYETLP